MYVLKFGTNAHYLYNAIEHISNSNINTQKANE